MWIAVVVNIVALALIGGLFFYFLRGERLKNRFEEEKGLGEFREQVSENLDKTTETLRGELRHLQGQLGEHMMRQSDILLKTNTGLNDRMDNAARVMSDVHKELGKMSTVAHSIDELQSILKAPKMRGGFGELFLNDLLAQILPSEHFSLQYHFKNGEAVDAAIFLGDKIVPIDSKFPLENFQRIVNESDGDVTKQMRRQFINDIKKHIQAVSKYIRTDEGTYDFALMYIPAENVYYEVVVKDDVGGEGREVFNYALKHRVIPVSPNTIYAYLITVIQGLKGMQIEKHAEAMLAKMGRIQKDFDSFQKVFSRLGTHLENARKSYEDADKRMSKVDGKLQEFLPSEVTDPQLPEQDPTDQEKYQKMLEKNPNLKDLKDKLNLEIDF